jgi:hypothetical protein
LWEDFVDALDALLKQPPILNAQGFKNLLRRKRNSDRVLKCVELLRESDLYRVECRIPKKIYEQIFLSELPKWLGKGVTEEDLWRLKNEYYVGFFATICSILLPLSLAGQPTTKLQVIYDLNINEAAKLKTAYKDFFEMLPEAAGRLVAEPHGEADDDFIAILSADLLAWHIHRDFVEAAHGRKHRDLVWDALCQLPKYPEIEWSEENLRELAHLDELAELVAKEHG